MVDDSDIVTHRWYKLVTLTRRYLFGDEVDETENICASVSLVCKFDQYIYSQYVNIQTNIAAFEVVVSEIRQVEICEMMITSKITN
ncbi:hypothetical protein HOLleu_24078 [Holothuria leucospilota]|uniref:Uncharacterized protein n=1 Tax=Holothuria leucospilota TaxID=206669 RepID=A0A9Q1H576_HOLLE|nr:hypothetical protein HOLleu_24078 [Holothuria leucospilota]